MTHKYKFIIIEWQVYGVIYNFVCEKCEKIIANKIHSKQNFTKKTNFSFVRVVVLTWCKCIQIEKNVYLKVEYFTNAIVVYIKNYCNAIMIMVRNEQKLPFCWEIFIDALIYLFLIENFCFGAL